MSDSNEDAGDNPKGQSQPVAEEENQTGPGPSPKMYHVIKITSVKLVTERMVHNVLQRADCATPISVRVIQKSSDHSTVIFVLFKKEDEASEAFTKLEDQVLQKKSFQKELFKAADQDIPKDESQLNPEKDKDPNEELDYEPVSSASSEDEQPKKI